MSWKKNVTDGPREVPLLGGRVVQPGEVVEVPDFQPGHDEKDNPLPIVWPEATWQDVPQPKAAAKSAPAAKE